MIFITVITYRGFPGRAAVATVYQRRGYKFEAWPGMYDSTCPVAKKNQNVKQKQYCHKLSKALTKQATSKTSLKIKKTEQKNNKNDQLNWVWKTVFQKNKALLFFWNKKALDQHSKSYYTININ